MNATQLIEEWRRQGRVLEVEGANTVLWRIGQGETVICVHGVPTSGFLYRKLLPELASRGLEGVTLDLPGLGLADRPADFDYSWSGLATWYLKAIDAAGIQGRRRNEALGRARHDRRQHHQHRPCHGKAGSALSAGSSTNQPLK